MKKRKCWLIYRVSCERKRRQPNLLWKTKKHPVGMLFVMCVCLTKSEPFLNGTDRLRFAPAEHSGAAEFPPHPPSAAPSLLAPNFFRKAAGYFRLSLAESKSFGLYPTTIKLAITFGSPPLVNFAIGLLTNRKIFASGFAVPCICP